MKVDTRSSVKVNLLSRIDKVLVMISSYGEVRRGEVSWRRGDEGGTCPMM
jgi:hypothetical protein